MSSKGYLAIWAGSALLALAGCDAGYEDEPVEPAAEAPAADDNMAMYEPDEAAEEEVFDDPAADDPYATTDPMADDPMPGADRTQDASGMTALESMSPEEIVGTPVLSRDGEEIGNVEQVVNDPTSGQQFAVVDVGGFLGIGEKSIVIALNELEATGEDLIKSDLTRDALETEEEYVPADYEPFEEEPLDDPIE